MDRTPRRRNPEAGNGTGVGVSGFGGKLGLFGPFSSSQQTSHSVMNTGSNVTMVVDEPPPSPP
jgi:hypothetical protein